MHRVPGTMAVKLTTGRSHYVYDGATARLLRVPPALYDLVDIYHNCSEEDALRSIEEDYGRAPAEAAYRQLHQLVAEHGVLATAKFAKRMSPLNAQEVREAVAEGVGQLTLEVTEACNMRCRYCAYSGGYSQNRCHGLRTMSWRVAKAAVDLFAQRNSSYRGDNLSIGFYGGEPLLAASLIERVIDYALSVDVLRGKQLGFTITTNGTLFTEETMRLLAAHNVSVLVSLDGPRSEHDRSRRYADGSPSYHAVMGRLREYRDRYSAFYVSHVSFNAVGSPATDLLELDRFFSQNALCKDNTVRLGSVADGHVSFLDTCPRNPLLAGQQALLSQQYCDARVRGHEPGKIASALYEQSITLFHKRRVVSGPVENPNTLSGCVPGCRKMYVATDGAIHMCERVGRGLSIGHVYHGIDVERLTQHFSMYAEFMSNEDCLGCWAFWLCTCCMAHVDDAQGFSIERKTRYCTAAKLTAMNTIMQYCVVLEQNPDAWAYLDRVSIG